MAITITLAEFAAAIRAGDGENEPTGPERIAINGIFEAVKEIVTRTAPEAPDAVANEAVVRAGGYLYDAPESQSSNFMVRSGAAGLLKPFQVRRLATGGEIEAAPAIGGTTGGVPAPDTDALNARISAEETARENADTALGRRITTEEQTRTNEDSELKRRVLARENDDGAFDRRITAVETTADANKGFLATFAARVQAVIERIVPAWARASDPPLELPSHEQSQEYVLKSRAGNLYWEPVNEVPNTPGDSTGVGHILTVTGEDDQDFAWRAAPAGGGGGMVRLATGGGLAYRNGELHTVPSLVAVGQTADANTGNINVLTRRLADVETDASDNETDITRVDGKADANAQGIVTNKGLVDALTARIAALEAATVFFVEVEPVLVNKSANRLQRGFSVFLHDIRTTDMPTVTNLLIRMEGNVVYNAAWTAAAGARVIQTSGLSSANAGTVIRIPDLDHLDFDFEFRDASNNVVESRHAVVGFNQ